MMGYNAPVAVQQAFGQEALGAGQINKQPGQSAFYDFEFEHQGPATRVYCRAFLESIDTGSQISIDLPQATAWTRRTARVNFTVPLGTPTGTYTPFVRICEPANCSGALIWATTTAWWVAVAPAVPSFGLQNAAITGVG